MQTDATTPNNVGTCSAKTCNNMQQGVQTDATCNIPQRESCWRTTLRSFGRGLIYGELANCKLTFVYKLQSWTKVLGTVLQYSYFSSTSKFPFKRCIFFENFLQFSLPPPFRKLKLEKNSGYKCPTVCGVRGGVGSV